MPDIDRVYEHLLAVRCRTGDRAAFAELVALYHPHLRLYVRKMLGGGRDGGGDAEADDVLQDVWLAVYRGVHKLADAAALRAWVYRIAHARTALAFRRRPPPTVELDHAESAGAIAADGADETSNGEFAPEDAAEMYAALDAVSTEHREALLLRYVEQMNYEQIAEVTGCGVGTVRSRLHYAKLRLRQEIE